MFAMCEIFLRPQESETGECLAARQRTAWAALAQQFGGRGVNVGERSLRIGPVRNQEALAEIRRCLEQLGSSFHMVVEDTIERGDLDSSPLVTLTIDARGPLDRDGQGRPLNQPQSVLCSCCGAWGQDGMCATHIVLGSAMRKGQELYLASDGIFVAHRRAYDIVMELAAKELASGKAEVLAPPKWVDPEGWFWLRPTQETGRSLDAAEERVCPCCGRPTYVWRRYEQDDGRIRIVYQKRVIEVERLPDPVPGIILAGSWYGTRSLDRSMNVWRDVFASASVYRALVQTRIKGLLRPEALVREAE